MEQDVTFEKFRREGRMTGRSTRIIDDMVQHLFDEGWVIITDHYYSPNNDQPVLNNMHKLRKRLYNEHDMYAEDLEYNSKERKLTIKKSYYDRYKYDIL